jgi:hypothetical protein
VIIFAENKPFEFFAEILRPPGEIVFDARAFFAPLGA